eukprot:1078107_1
MRKSNNPLHIVRDIFELKHTFQLHLINTYDHGYTRNIRVFSTTLISDVKSIYLNTINVSGRIQIQDMILYDDNNTILVDDHPLDYYNIATNSTIYIKKK